MHPSFSLMMLIASPLKSQPMHFTAPKSELILAEACESACSWHFTVTQPERGAGKSQPYKARIAWMSYTMSLIVVALWLCDGELVTPHDAGKGRQPVAHASCSHRRKSSSVSNVNVTLASPTGFCRALLTTSP